MPLATCLPLGLPQGKADNQILGVVQALREQHAPREGGAGVQGHQHARQGARARPGDRGLPNDKTLDDLDLMYSGALALPAGLLGQARQDGGKLAVGQHTFYRVSGPIVPSLLINQFVYFEAPGEPSLYARVTEIRGKTAVLRR
jgi:PhoH-like ATPase